MISIATLAKRIQAGGRLVLLCLIGAGLSGAQERGVINLEDYSRNPDMFPRIYTPYVMKKVPQVELANSDSLLKWIRDGKLQLSLEQFKAAVRENNLDILSTSYNARYGETDTLRAKGGGAPRGAPGVSIPSSLFTGAIGAGVGGSSTLGSFSSAAISGGAKQVTASPRGSYDPSLALGFSLDRTDSPLNSIRVSGLPETVTTSTALQARYSQAFTTGTSISAAFNNMRQGSTQEYLIYNPDFISTFTFTVTQQLLNGAGKDVGRRFVEVTKNEAKVLQQSVRLQLNTTLASALNTYWDVAAARDNVRVAEQSLQVATRLYEDNKMREALGSLAYLDVVTAESQMAAAQRDLVVAQTTLQMRELDLKNVIGRQFDSALGTAQIMVTDPLPEPKDSDILKFGDALAAAMKNRAEILQGEIGLDTQEIAIKYERNQLKPSLVIFGQFASSGLFGDRTFLDANGQTVVLPGGISQVMRQVRNWGYPDISVGFSLSFNIRNRSAGADSYRTKLERQQSETALQGTRNSIALEIRKAIIGLAQNKAQLEAAHKATQLSEETLAAEESRLAEGVSTPYTVIQRQRDLTAAQSAEIQARANYAKALVELDRSTGVLDSK